MVKVAIIVPIYNAGGVLDTCIKSLVEQTYEDINIILVDDGSKDESGNICDAWKEKDERIFVIHQENQGSTAARKNGLFCDLAQNAEYVCFCDADDVMNSDAIEQMVKIAEESDVDLVCANVQKKVGKYCYSRIPDCMKSEQMKIYDHNEIMDSIYLSCFGLQDFPMGLYGKLYRTDLITKAFQGDKVVYFVGDDVTIFVRYIPMLEKLGILPQILYTQNHGGFTSKFMPHYMEDYLSLYSYRKPYAEKYFDTEEPIYFLNKEMMFVTKRWLLTFYALAKHSKKELSDEIKRVIREPIICQAADFMSKKDEKISVFAKRIDNKEEKKIKRLILRESKKIKLKGLIKKIISKIKK